MKNVGDIKLSINQARKVFVLEQLSVGKMTNREASSLLDLSLRQAQRAKARFCEIGFNSLVHGNTGLKPPNFFPQEIRDLVAERAELLWKGTSAQHMSELLFDETHISVSAKSVTRFLQEAGIRIHFSHKGPRKRRGRKRRPRFGEMLQIDASPFDWLSNGSMISLHGAIDDATGKVVALWLEPTERLNGYFKVLKRTILTYGVPRSIYSDAHSIFFSPKSGKLTVQDELEGKSVAFTQFGKALEILGINPIKALSPQAKGRIERLWGTLQHRLVVDMRVAGIKTIDEANAFLASYVIKHDGLFAVAPEEEESAFLPAPSEEDLEYILCRRENRKASGDSTISWKGKKWMAVDAKKRQILLKRSATVEILTLLDDSIALQHDGNIFRLERFITAPMEEKNPSGAKDLEKARETPHIPAPDHPWRRWNEKRKKKEKSPLHIVTAGTEG